MRQVPLPRESAYLLVGNGKLSRHLQFYLSKRGLPFRVERFPRLLRPSDREGWAECNRVLLLVSDDALESVYGKLRPDFPEETVFIHCSGSRTIEGVFGAHPLMTFGESLYDAAFYAQIPFVFSSQEVKSFSELFPSLPNPAFSVRKDQRALYHAACVGAGNFPMLIWRDVFKLLEQDLSLPKEAMRPFLEQCLRNSLSAPGKNLTGPFVRGDVDTIARHQRALAGKPFLSLYNRFVDWWSERSPATKGD